MLFSSGRLSSTMLDGDCGVLLSVSEDDEAADTDDVDEEVDVGEDFEVVDTVEAGGSDNVLTVDPVVFRGVLFSPQPVRLKTAAAQIAAEKSFFFIALTFLSC